jgi:branched-chain amino acid transport system substrate-binding protein
LVRILLIGLALALASGCGRSSVSEPVYVGHIAPLSGAAKVAGEHARHGIELALTSVNKPANESGRPLAVLHVDSRSDSRNLAPETVRLLTINHVVGVLGGLDTPSALELGKAARPYDAPIMTFAELPALPSMDNVFSVNANVNSYARTLAKFAVDELRSRHPAILVDTRDPDASAFADFFSKTILEKSGTRVETLQFSTETELTGLVRTFEKLKTDALVLTGAASNVSLLGRTLKTSNLPILHGVANLQSDWLTDRALDLNGVYLVTPFVAGVPDSSSFEKDYSERFHEKPDAVALLAYDAILILADAVRDSTPLNAGQLRASLLKPDRNFKGVFGPLRLDETQSVRRPLFVVQVRNGEPRLVKRYEAEAAK